MPCPDELLLSRLCEEFPGVLPSQIAEEDLALLLDIIETRAFAAAKEAVDNHDGPEDQAPKGPSVELVKEIKWLLYQETLRGNPDG